jgi:hypothetical protein
MKTTNEVIFMFGVSNSKSLIGVLSLLLLVTLTPSAMAGKPGSRPTLTGTFCKNVLQGTWKAGKSANCAITSNVTNIDLFEIKNGDRLTVYGLFTNQGFIYNSGEIVTADSGTIDNQRTINNLTSGLIQNNGTIRGNTNELYNSGSIKNAGLFDYHGEITNFLTGTITNNAGKSFQSYGALNNNGVFNNFGTFTIDNTDLTANVIYNNGIFNNFTGGSIIVEFTTFLVNNSGGTITNDGTIINNGNITNNSGGSVTGSGTIIGTGTITGTIPYSVGSTGPGGGIVYYVSTSSFSAPGAACSPNCRYLEVAPSTGLSPWTDATYACSGNENVAIGETAQGTSIGAGYANTLAIVGQADGGNAIGRAATSSRAYQGPNNLNDWYLPSRDELSELCKYARTLTTGNTNQLCSGGTLRSGFIENVYWSSTEFDMSKGWAQYFGLPATQDGLAKLFQFYVRPIRVF